MNNFVIWLKTHLISIQAWLKTHISNSWMANNYYVAFMAHSGWCGLILAIGAIIAYPTLPNLMVIGILSAGMILFAAVKEFWYDANYELPKQQPFDNITDFLGYVAGVGIIWLTILIKWLIIR
jgi:hypothetical protein